MPSSHESHRGTCHTRRESRATIDAVVAAGRLGFLNVHELPVAASSTEGTGSSAASTRAKFTRPPQKHAQRNQCTRFHAVGAPQHSFRITTIWESSGASCHLNETGPKQVPSIHIVVYDVTGNALEPPRLAELETSRFKVLVAMPNAARQLSCYEATPMATVSTAAPAQAIGMPRMQWQPTVSNPRLQHS